MEESRSISGIGYETVTIRTGSIRPDGSRAHIAKATFSDRPNGLFEYDAVQRSAFFQYDGVVTTAVDDGQNLTSYGNYQLLWYDPFADDPYNISFVGTQGPTSPYIAYASNTFQNEDRSETVQAFAGGPRTRPDDFPPRGYDERSFAFSAQVLETETLSGGLDSNDVSIEFDFASDKFAADPLRFDLGENAGSLTLSLSLTGTLTRSDASLVAQVTDSVSGATAVLRGSCFGPYGEAVYMAGIMELNDGRQIMLTIYS
ncbi:hypothetical protein [Pelagerythrobacter sp.]|uniref:hypothetical protein n=1 Tax=Pelagerythrobacter sp. TaxID=2800702 RepID=UPI0035B4E4E2